MSDSTQPPAVREAAERLRTDIRDEHGNSRIYPNDQHGWIRLATDHFVLANAWMDGYSESGESLPEQVARLSAEVARLTTERDAYRRAKQENDERFMTERDAALSEVARLTAENKILTVDNAACKERMSVATAITRGIFDMNHEETLEIQRLAREVARLRGLNAELVAAGNYMRGMGCQKGVAAWDAVAGRAAGETNNQLEGTERP